MRQVGKIQNLLSKNLPILNNINFTVFCCISEQFISSIDTGK